MSLHTLSPFAGSKKNKKRVGRGHGSAHGTTATRGTKGQRARSGVSGLKARGLRQTLLRVPKLRGFTSLHSKPLAVNVAALDAFADGATVTPATLEEKNLIRLRRGAREEVKILGAGALSRKLTVKGCRVSKAAQEKIEKAGGKIE